LWIAVYCFSAKENKLAFAANRWKFAVSVFRLQQKMEVAVSVSSIFRIYTYIETAAHLHIYGKQNSIYKLPFQMENRSPGNFLQSVYRLLITQMEVCHLSMC
jgi:hypothetical protein